MRVILDRVASDLAPGDEHALAFDWTACEVVSITSPQDPLVSRVYPWLWSEFGSSGELERREVLEARMRWDPGQPCGGTSLGYEMIAVLRGGALIAARDHTAILLHGAAPEAIVHLSHVLIEPGHRGTGLSGWLRAWPIQWTRSCLSRAGLPVQVPITLVAEMELYDPAAPDRIPRLRSYENAGFRMIDPGIFAYLQPSFLGGGAPLPLGLMIRRVGRETEERMTGAELARTVRALYQMYDASLEPQAMSPVWHHARTALPPAHAVVRLVKPLGQDAQAPGPEHRRPGRGDSSGS